MGPFFNRLSADLAFPHKRKVRVAWNSRYSFNLLFLPTRAVGEYCGAIKEEVRGQRSVVRGHWTLDLGQQIVIGLPRGIPGRDSVAYFNGVIGH